MRSDLVLHENPAPAGAGGPEHFVHAATSLGSPPTETAHWNGLHTQRMLLPPGGWAHPGSSFVRLTIPMGHAGRVRRKLSGEDKAWKPGLKRQGTFSLTPPGAEGTWEWLDRSDFGLMFIPQSLFVEALAEADVACPVLSLRPVFAEADDVVGPVFRMIGNEIAGEGRTSRLLLSSAALFLTRYLLRRYGAGDLFGPAECDALDDRRLGRVVDAIEATLSHDWSVHELAREAGMSPFRFAHVFKQKMGVSPRCFVQRKRLAAAKRMLRQPSSSIAQIAARCGFESQSWFTTCFRRMFGVTPAAYRRCFEPR